MNPIVINSKKAREHFEKIKTDHDDMVRRIGIQKEKVEQNSLLKNQEKKESDLMASQSEKENQVREDNRRKDYLTFSQKQAELDLKNDY